MNRSPIAQGSWIAMLAAALFGITTPLVTYFGAHSGPFATAAVLYAGAAVGARAPLRRRDEPAVTFAQAPRIALLALFGAALAPCALAWGLQRSGALAGSLLLNLEALFTVLLAALIYREPIGKRVAVAIGLMLIAGTLLAFRLQGGGTSSVVGLGALVVATFCWGIDNTLTRPLSDFDPRSVVLWKAAGGAVLSGAAALALHEVWPAPLAVLALGVCGMSGYGLSLRLYLRAQRTLGAARTGSLFALAPFLGAIVAFTFGDRSGGELIVVASLLFGSAAYLHVTEQHRHRHCHEALDHEHAHTHDDGHHDHHHDPPVVGSHTHPHHHEPVEHEHSHGEDLHHRHPHA